MKVILCSRRLDLNVASRLQLMPPITTYVLNKLKLKYRAWHSFKVYVAKVIHVARWRHNWKFPPSWIFIRHLHISHNAPYLFPKFGTTFLFHFSWVLQPSQEKLKTMLMQNFGGQVRCIVGNMRVANSVKKATMGRGYSKLIFKKNVLKLYNLFWRQRLSKNLWATQAVSHENVTYKTFTSWKHSNRAWIFPSEKKVGPRRSTSEKPWLSMKRRIPWRSSSTSCSSGNQEVIKNT